MSYTNETTHFGIPLPLGSDLTTPMDYNEAAEAIDTALFEAQGDAATANENAAAAVETANATSEALGTLSTTVGGHTSQIAALAARMTGAENDITDVRSDLEDMVTAYNEPTATSTHAYAIGDYFIYNDVLYKATATIAIGNTIVPNTNCEATNITTEVSAIKSDLTELTKNNAGTYTDLSTYTTFSNAFVCPSDGYAFVDNHGGTDMGYISVYGADSTSDNELLAKVVNRTAYEVMSLYVRKGCKLVATVGAGTPHIRFYSLT